MGLHKQLVSLQKLPSGTGASKFGAGTVSCTYKIMYSYIYYYVVKQCCSIPPAVCPTSCPHTFCAQLFCDLILKLVSFVHQMFKLVDLLKAARGPWSVSPGCKIRHRLQTCSCFLFKNIMTAFVLSLLFTKLIAIILHTGTYTKVI